MAPIGPAYGSLLGRSSPFLPEVLNTSEAVRVLMQKGSRLNSDKIVCQALTKGGGHKPLDEKPSNLGGLERFCLSLGHGHYLSLRPCPPARRRRKVCLPYQFRLGNTALCTISPVPKSDPLLDT
jgi:hypothetical protein